MKKYIEYCEGNKEIESWVNTVVAATIKKFGENQGEIEHILDYLKSSSAPKRLRKMSYKQAKVSTDKWLKSLMKRGKNINETDADVEVVLKFSSGMQLVKLVGKAAYAREGLLMSHCVAGYYDEKDRDIYSLRDKNNQPHCTIEVKRDGGNINQIKGKGNGSIHPKYINYVLKSLKKIGKDIRESELKYLGYENPEEVTEGLLSFLDERFELKYVMFNNKKFVYMHNMEAKS